MTKAAGRKDIKDVTRDNLKSNESRVAVVLSLVSFVLLSLVLFSGCESVNQDPNNKRWWFPSFQSPGHLNPEHEYWTTGGSDPFMDPTVGPRSLQSRPTGYEVPRSRSQQLMDSEEKTVLLKK